MESPAIGLPVGRSETLDAHLATNITPALKSSTESEVYSIGVTTDSVPVSAFYRNTVCFCFHSGY